MDSCERGTNPVAMTIINPRTEYWPSQGSNQPPPVLKSAILPTELWGSALNSLEADSDILTLTMFENSLHIAPLIKFVKRG